MTHPTSGGTPTRRSAFTDEDELDLAEAPPVSPSAALRPDDEVEPDYDDEPEAEVPGDQESAVTPHETVSDDDGTYIADEDPFLSGLADAQEDEANRVEDFDREPVTPAPSGLTPIRGFSARVLAGIEEIVETDEDDQPTQTLWGADDIVAPSVIHTEDSLSAFADDTNDRVDETDSDRFDDSSSLYGGTEIPETYRPGEIADEDELDVDRSDDDYYDYDEPESAADGDDESQYLAAPDTPLSPEDCRVDDEDDPPPHSMRDRAVRRRDSAVAAKLDKAEKGPPYKVAIAVLILLAAGFGGYRYLANDKGSDNTTTAAPPPSTSSTLIPTATAPATTDAGDPCLSNPEVVDKPTVCSSEGNQQTGTNAILAYDFAFYGSRDAEKAYALTAASAKAVDDISRAKGISTLQANINGTPCGSKYTLTVTPKTIGQIYDVVLLVTSAQDAPVPSADGRCATTPEPADTERIVTRTLQQTVTVDGAPGSYVVSKIDTHSIK